MGTLKTLFFILLMVNVAVCNVKTKIRQETITVTQHTASPRAKRDIYANPEGLLDGNDFPDTMDFTLHLKETDYMIHLSKHVTPQDVKLRDRNGRIYFDSFAEKIQFAVYQDMETHSTMIVDCLDSSDSCTLEGSFHKDGIRWLLQSLKGVPGKYNVTEVPYDYDPYSVKMLNVSSLHKTKQQGVFERIMDYFTNGKKRERRDIPVIRGQNIKTGDQARDGRSVPDILGLKTDINRHVIKKRNIQTTCNIIEMQARVDATVYNFYLAQESDPHAAKVAIYRDLLQLFGQTDLRYKCLIEEGICIRVYLQDVFIEENAGTDFITESSMMGFYDATASITELGTRKSGGDLIAGFTRLRTDFLDEPRFRGVGFGDTLCDGSQSNFQAVLLELTGDNDDLVMAQLMLYPMNVLWDGFYGCPDDETFVGAQFQVPPTPGNEHNPWQFSTCSITNIQNFLASRSDCLKDGDIDEKRLEAESTIRMMPGRMADFDSLCEETYGSASTACQAAGETSIFDIDDICYLGVYCTLNGNCVNRTRVPNGSPCGCNEYCFKNKCVLGETVALGEACTGCCTCSEPNSDCDCETRFCTCNEGFYEAPNGTCIPGEGVGGPCAPGVPGTCDGENTVCAPNGTCVCADDFVDCPGFGCLPYQGINEDCSCNEQCYRVYGMCIDYKCKCSDPKLYYVDFCGVCRNRVEINGNCSGEALCLDPKAFCDPHTQECVCSDETYDNNGTCTDLIPLGDPCMLEGSCEDCNAECESECNCIKGYFPKDGVCIPYQAINEPCLCDEQCVAVNGVCTIEGGGGVCKCPNNDTYYVDLCGFCQDRVEINGNCSGEALCLDPKAFCDPHTQECVCSDETYDNNGTCTDLIPLGDPCMLEGSCEDCNAECESECNCIKGYFPKDGVCIPFQSINEYCICDSQCALVGGTCQYGVCKCNSSTEYVDECGNCTDRPAIGENCQGQEVVCLDENAVCDPMSNMCFCADWFYDSNFEAPGGTCEEKIPLNYSCPFDAACKDENSECASPGYTCQCINGFVDCFTDSEAVCLPYQAINEPCLCDEQCVAVNGVCTIEGGGGVCKCPNNDTYYVDLCGFCQDRVEINGNCSGEALCLDPKAFCDPHTQECVCSDETYDNNGTCTDLIPLGDPCMLEGSCEDCNAECESECNCIKGYFPKDGVCIPYQAINEPCLCDEQCVAVNGVCTIEGGGGVCKCPNNDTYYVDLCGFCQDRVEINGNCSGEALCLDPKAFCDPHTQECVCSDETYDNNGTCTDLIPLGDPCMLEGSCEDCNAECQSECNCIKGYFPKDGVCIPYQAINEPCLCDEQCVAVNGVCTIEGGGGVCKCPNNDTYYVDLCGFCQDRVEINGNCSGEALCLDPKAFCDPHTQECVCSDETYDNNGTCTDLIPLGDPCMLEGSCEDCNAECQSECNCIKGYFPKDGVCIPFQSINEYCICDSQCALVGGTCQYGVCKCNSSTEYVDECGNCTDRPAIGENCQGQEVVCLDENAVCDPMSNMCFCADGFYDSNFEAPGGTCEEKIPLNYSCPFDAACKDENSECASPGYTCQCINGFVDCFTDSEALCLPYQAINEPCLCDEQCVAVNGVCTIEGGGGVCKCPNNDTYYVDLCGFCQDRPSLGDPCTDVTPCLGDFAFCSPMSMTCVCVGPTININGICEPLVPLNGSCTANNQCEDENAVCAWDNTCQCADGFVDCPNDSEPKCLAEEAISEGCVCDQQCYPVQGECLGDPGVCKCPMPMELYTVDDCGICRKKRLLGDNCTDAVPCIDSKAYCDPCEGICVCSNGYYGSITQTCVQQVGLGEPCTLVIECEDPNAICTEFECQCGPGYMEQNGVCVCNEAPSDCGEPPHDDFGYFKLNSTSEGATADLVCCEGYESMTTTITCLASGWTTPTGNCTAITCAIPDVDYGTYVCGGSEVVTVGGLITLECDDGYGPCSDDICRVCQPDGQFSSASAICEKDCGIPSYEDDKGYYVLNQSRTLEGDTATLFCCEDYFISCNVQITCQASGKWSSPSETCKRCPEKWYQFGSTCYYPRNHHSTWQEAVDFCDEFDKDGYDVRLLKIDTVAELNYVKNVMRRLRYGSGFWNGLFQYNENDGGELWHPDQAPLVVSDWDNGEPNDRARFNRFQKQFCTAHRENDNFKQSDIECHVDFKDGGQNGREYNAFCELDLLIPCNPK